MPFDLETVRRARDAAEPRLLEIPGVTAIDAGLKHVGETPTAEIAIRVHVAKKLPLDGIDASHRIPAEIDGVPTDVIEGSFELHHTVAPAPDVARYDPLLGGISVGPCALPPSAGTLGCCVRDRATGKSLVLSSFHTFTGGGAWQPGQKIAQPSRVDGGACPPDAAALLLRAVLDAEVDAAVAQLAGRGLANGIAEVGQIVGAAAATLGLRVRKRGRTTRLTWGVVDAIDMTVRVATGAATGPLLLKRQIGIRVDPLANRHFGLPGDSGAVVVDGSNRAVGLYVAGSTDGRIGIANDFQRVLDALQLDTCTVGKPGLKEKPEIKDKDKELKEKPEPKEKAEGKEKPELGEKPPKEGKPELKEKEAKENPKEKSEVEKPSKPEVDKAAKSELADKGEKLEGKAQKDEGESKPQKPEPNETKPWDPKELTDWEIWRWKQETGKEPGPENEAKAGDIGWPPEEEGPSSDDLIRELEGEVERLRHFIHARLRPNLARGALKWETDVPDPAAPGPASSSEEEEGQP